MRAGFTETGEFDFAVDGAGDDGAPHAATHNDSVASKANGRTPVDTTGIA
jgi:hypothetical protein